MDVFFDDADVGCDGSMDNGGDCDYFGHGPGSGSNPYCCHEDCATDDESDSH